MSSFHFSLLNFAPFSDLRSKCCQKYSNIVAIICQYTNIYQYCQYTNIYQYCQYADIYQYCKYTDRNLRKVESRQKSEVGEEEETVFFLLQICPLLGSLWLFIRVMTKTNAKTGFLGLIGFCRLHCGKHNLQAL